MSRSEYIAARNIRSSSSLGMNSPKINKRFGRMVDAFQESAVYWGEHRDWYIVAAQHRDSESIDRSNFTVLLTQLGGASSTVAVERANHWAVGWVEYLIVAPEDHQSLRKAILAHSAVSNYPVLDDDHFSGLEYDEAYETAEQELKDYGDHWYDAWYDATSNCGFSSDEVWSAIEEAREELEELAPLYESHASCLIDPGQMKLWDCAPHL